MSTLAPAPAPAPPPARGTAARPGRTRRVVLTGSAAVASLALVALGVAPQLSARLTGDELLLRVAPVDPIDPFRGAYVRLDYPDLRTEEGSWPPAVDDGARGPVYAVLEQRPAADGRPATWGLARWSRVRPTEERYLACDDSDWAVECGIESWFVPQDEAQRLERVLGTTGALATVRVDDEGHAAIVDLRAP